MKTEQEKYEDLITEIDYQDIVSLGFKKMESKDDIWEAEYGYPYFIMVLKLDSDRWQFDWTPDDRKVALSKNYVPMKKNLTLEEIEWFIELLTPPNYE